MFDKVGTCIDGTITDDQTQDTFELKCDSYGWFLEEL